MEINAEFLVGCCKQLSKVINEDLFLVCTWFNKASLIGR